MKRRKRDAELTLQVGKRIKELMGTMSNKDLAEVVGVATNTMWDYVNGVTLPGMEVLIKIADHFGVTTDYILKGQESLFPKDEFERKFIHTMREAEKEGVADVAERNIRFLISEKKRAHKKAGEGGADDEAAQSKAG